MQDGLITVGKVLESDPKRTLMIVVRLITVGKRLVGPSGMLI
jgi:hypothetical protein